MVDCNRKLHHHPPHGFTRGDLRGLHHGSGKHGTLYIGVMGNLSRRVWEHREGLIPGFTVTYDCKRLVWYRSFERMTNAIRTEKTMKRWVRQWKVNLIERDNPNWDDLYGVWL